jgi:NADH-quinone oxidoreductase subunit E
MPAVDLTAARSIVESYGRRKESLIHILQDVQAAYRYLPREAVALVAGEIGVPFSKVYGAATFYKAFSLEPRGQLVVRVCTGTACHIRGAQVLVDEAAVELGVAPGRTTADMRFTLETVNCVGACAMAPVVQAGDRYLGHLKPGELAKYLAATRPTLVAAGARAPSECCGHCGGSQEEAKA